jgi:hypothetical protein
LETVPLKTPHTGTRSIAVDDLAQTLLYVPWLDQTNEDGNAFLFSAQYDGTYIAKYSVAGPAAYPFAVAVDSTAEPPVVYVAGYDESQNSFSVATAPLPLNASTSFPNIYNAFLSDTQPTSADMHFSAHAGVFAWVSYSSYYATPYGLVISSSTSEPSPFTFTDNGPIAIVSNRTIFQGTSNASDVIGEFWSFASNSGAGIIRRSPLSFPVSALAYVPPTYQCPNNCFGAGACMSDGTCECSEYFAFSNDCSVECDDAQFCSGQGKCSEVGTCDCELGYSGPHCANKLTPPPLAHSFVAFTQADIGYFGRSEEFQAAFLSTNNDGFQSPTASGRLWLYDLGKVFNISYGSCSFEPLVQVQLYGDSVPPNSTVSEQNVPCGGGNGTLCNTWVSEDDDVQYVVYQKNSTWFPLSVFDARWPIASLKLDLVFSVDAPKGYFQLPQQCT